MNVLTVQLEGEIVTNFLPEAVPLMSDCWLSTDEIASLPSVVDFVNNQFIPNMASDMGVGVDTISINGLSSAGLGEPGCGTSTAPSGR